MKRLEEIGHNIDAAMDAGDMDGVLEAIKDLDTLQDQVESEQAVFWYYRANAYHEKAKLHPHFKTYQLRWEQSEATEEIYSLRRATQCSDFANCDPIRKCQIWTNLGNVLSRIGRPVEAIHAWDKALRVNPNFAMAAANRAQGLVGYSAALYDHGHRIIYLHEAVKGYRTALGPDAVWESDYPPAVKELFEGRLSEVEEFLKEHRGVEVPDYYAYDLGDADYENALNEWRLENRLFLNPLNDIGNIPIAAQDVFHLPNHTYKVGEEPRFVRYFDLIKQEYVAACVIMFEGLQTDGVHPADRLMLTFEHADYSISSIELEKQKAAFRMAYSILDKCAVFVNDYFGLGKDPRSPKASFRHIWKEGRTLNEALPLDNWRLRGVYSISRDIYDKRAKEVSSPLAVKADALRNAAEHRFVILYEMGKVNQVPELCESVSTQELEELAIQMLRLARATIMGLSLSIYHQETYLKDKPKGTITVPIASIPKHRE